MKKYYTLLLALVVFKTGIGQGYQVTLNTPDYKSGITYLTITWAAILMWPIRLPSAIRVRLFLKDQPNYPGYLCCFFARKQAAC